jgi:hypothetical protein
MGWISRPIKGIALCNETASQLEDGSLVMELIVDDADRYSRFKMKHESTRASFPPGRGVELPIPLGVDLPLAPGEHVPPRIVQRQRRSPAECTLL